MKESGQKWPLFCAPVPPIAPVSYSQLMHLFPSLGELVESPGAENMRVARMLGLPGEATRKDFTNLFVIQLFPYASIYVSPNGLAGGAIRDEIAQYHALLDAPIPDEPDHVASLLKWYGVLQSRLNGYMKEDNVRQVRQAFFWNCIASWLPIYLIRSRELGSQLYRAWSEVTLDVLEAEAVQVGMPTTVPAALLTAPPLPSVRDPAAFVESLFVPITSGLLLCRSDLGRCAAENRLVVRVADRRTNIKAFLTENTAGVCSWLYSEALRQADNIRMLPPAFGPMREFWIRRVEASANALIEFRSVYATGKRSVKLF
jgi:TorA maturation chaperone TorD